MSITDLIPGWRERGKHRPDTVISALREENRRLLTRLMATDDYFALLIDDRIQVYAAWEYEQQRRAEAELVAACVQSERDDLADEVVQLRRELAPYLAAEANAGAVTLPPVYRDTSDPADQATGPIDVRPLWEAIGIGPVVSLHYPPQAVDPAHIPAPPKTGPATTAGEGAA